MSVAICGCAAEKLCYFHFWIEMTLAEIAVETAAAAREAERLVRGAA